MTEIPTAIVFDSIEAAIADLQQGKMVVVVDDENRENEGDLIGAAQFATPAMINFMALRARGLICLAATAERLDELKLPLMVERNTDRNETAFTVSVDALDTSTGISAEDRSRTIQAFVNPHTKPEDLRRPGHVFPLRARAGGVLKRAGHTEAAVDLARLAGLYPAGVICEIQNEDGSMARLPELQEYARKYDLKLINIADLIAYRLAHERFVHREAKAKLPSQFGEFEVYAYRNELDNTEHLAIVKGQPETWGDRPVLVRVHSECLTGDALGSLRCDCRGQLQSALKMIEQAGQGVVIYLRQEGRGIGLLNKIKAYSWQDAGLDTVEANAKLGFGADLRTYGVGAQILTDLGIRQMRLITNNPRKISGLKGFGLTVVERVPLLMEANEYNRFYLDTKAEKLGHLLPTEGPLVGLVWHHPPGLHTVYLDKLRATLGDMLLQEDTTPAAAQRLGLAQRHGLPLNATIARIHGDRPDLDWLTVLCREAFAWPDLGEVRLAVGAVQTVVTVRLNELGNWQPHALYVVQR
ncbi:MAG: bifunctional 3,4-dihydroxy-2-butanone-4-phosphate synthase/GTP cyclohydrolase II [Pseudanabaenaceae cyanobacterium]